MSSFWDLVHFEVKKIFRRKSTYFSLMLVLFTAVLAPLGMLVGYTYVDGQRAESKYEVMKQDREFKRALKGPVDEALIQKVIKNTKNAMEDTKNYQTIEGKFSFTKEGSELFAQPYSDIYRMLRTVYASAGDLNGWNAVAQLTEEDAASFYKTRQLKVYENLMDKGLTDEEIEKHKQINSQIQVPLQYDFAEAFITFITFLATNGIFTALAVSICVAPIFAGEYSARTDSIILSTKNGRKKLIYAKLFTVITFSIVTTLGMALLTILTLGIAYGFDGANASLQIFGLLVTYPLTMLEAALAVTFVVTSAVLLTAAVTVFFSAKFKSPFGVIIISNIFLFVTGMIPIPQHNRFLSTIMNLLPSHMVQYPNVFSDRMVSIFGEQVVPYIAYPLLAILIAVLLLPFACQGFKKHQIA